MDPLVTLGTFVAAVGRPLTADELPRLTYLLTSASNAVRSYCRRDFTSGSSTMRIKPIGDMVKLPNAPVTGITSVYRVNFNGSLTGFAGWAWDGGQTVFGMGGIGAPMINAPEDWFDEEYVPFVEITYTHGGDVAPPVALDVVIAMVARVLNAPSAIEGMTSQTAGPFAVGMGANSATPGVTPKLSDEDKQRLRDAGLTAGRGNTTVALT